ncbi:MAG TPA: hypothetical protein DCE33_02170 [Rhodospirillaceae bacterium]|nr:hypothetical protein [Rhodospirillaceae bacterium]
MSSAPARNYQKLFPVPVLLIKAPEGPTLNENLIAEIDQVRDTTPNGKPDSWACDVYTTLTNNNRLHQRPALREFTGLVQQALAAFGEVMGYDLAPGDLEITQCWVNIYQTGMSQEIHHHPNNIMTGVYYLKAPADCSEILFHSPYADVMIRPPVIEDDPLNNPIAAIRPEPGDLIIFDSALRHSVPTSEIDGERISISFNARF